MADQLLEPFGGVRAQIRFRFGAGSREQDGCHVHRPEVTQRDIRADV